MDNHRSDADIHHDVLRELDWDTRIAANEIGVTVRNAVVTLTGTVGNWADKAAAADAAHRVPGVLDVANDIAVELVVAAARTDADLAEAVRHALRWDVLVPEDSIQSTVSNGFITLVGDVELESQRDDAARAVRAIRGISGVDNRIAVAPWSVTPSAIRDAIERVDRGAKDVAIDVAGGRVILTGHVHSGRERDAILDATWNTHGVETVVDHLVIA